MTQPSLLVELFVEELPPKVLNQLGQALANQLAAQLRALGLASTQSVLTPFASPRRLAAHLTQVAAKAPDRLVQQKLMPVRVALTPEGLATPALLKKLQALGADLTNPVAAVAALRRALDGHTETLFFDRLLPGVTLESGLQQALDESLAHLPIPKMMSYQLDSDCALPGWSSVNFVRPAHGLVALHGSVVLPVRALGLRAGRCTQGHRFEATESPLRLANADEYAQALLSRGAVIASFDQRRAEIERQLHAAATQLGARPIADAALLDEVTALVERPNVLACQFDAEFLAVPPECLILTMKANQKYFPLFDAQGQLTERFLVVSNISPADPSAVIEGNQRVVRPRLADAKFFFDQDRKKSLEARVAGLDKVVYHNQLGSQGERMHRVCAIAQALAELLEPVATARSDLACQAEPQADLARAVLTAGRLAKTDLLTDMVGEFPELQGIMGGYYARFDGLSEEISQAIEDHYKPRFAGDALARNPVGVLLALADKLETLVGMFGIGNLPSGEKDPFALRRHALGVIRMLIEKALPLALPAVLSAAIAVFGSRIKDPRVALLDFIYDRLTGILREQGYRALEVEAVLALRPQLLREVPERLAAVRTFSTLPEAAALAAANKRIGNILKKAQAIAAHVNPLLLQELPEVTLYARMQAVLPQAQTLYLRGDYAAALQALAALRVPVDDFFDAVMVNADAADLRLNRLGLLKTLHQAMNQVADLSRLAV